MKLAEVEQKAREQQKIDHELAIQKIAAEKLADQRAREKFRREVIAWMVQEGDLDAQELTALLTVADRVGELRLNVPEHQPITFTVMRSTQQKDEGWRVKNGHFYVESPDDPPLPIKCRSLGEALIEAGLLFQQDQLEDRAEAPPCSCGMGDASMPELHAAGCTINQARG